MRIFMGCTQAGQCSAIGKRETEIVG